MPPTRREQAAIAKKVEYDWRARQLARQKIQEHNERVARSNEIQETGKIVSRKRTKAPEVNARVPGSDADRAWWCKSEYRAVISASTYVPPPRPAGCPKCGGTRIRLQVNMPDGRMLFLCPEDYSKTILATGCGNRWLWSHDRGVIPTQSPVDNRTAPRRPIAITGPSRPDEAPDYEFADQDFEGYDIG